MKTITLLFLNCFTLICFSQEIIEKNYETFDSFLEEQASKIESISEGMTQQDVQKEMGSSIKVKVPAVGKMKALNQVFKQPEFVNKYARNPERVIDILWYFSTPKDQNGVISKNECTPIIFENDSLVGKGWSFLQAYRRSGKMR
ncbi:MAG: hypothetical protein BM563_01945 [Bacteroidetes bacterium MedPE-SWsnd-G1]|nr:MAG: hypothetical protein BM563_01945 [Bacteroidetes bacterium MedPE-SWsnd-G1]